MNRKAPTSSMNWKNCEQQAETVCERFKEARLMNGYTMETVGEMLGFSTDNKKTQISLWESGDRFVPMWALLKAAEIFGVSLDWLCGRTDEVEEFTADKTYIERFIQMRLAGTVHALASSVHAAMAAGAPAIAMSRELTRKADQALLTWTRFTQRNAGLDDFEDFPVATSMIRDMASLRDAVRTAQHSIMRYDSFAVKAIEHDVKKRGVVMPLFPELAPLNG